MIDNPLVSIIIPVYNADKYLSATIESALSQTWPNTEIIIVDDGSADESLLVAKKYESGQVRVFTQKNKGASAARNKGLLEAKGDYIQFLDADDLLNNNKIEAQLHLLKGKPFAISNCAIVHFFDGSNPFQVQPVHEWYQIGSTDSADFLIKLYGGGLIGPTYGGMITNHAWLCSKDVIEKAGYWNEELSVDDDGEFFCRVVLASKEIVYSPASVCYYRKYTNSISLSARNDYNAAKSTLMATDLKAAHLLNTSANADAKLAVSRLYYEHTFTFYPKYITLAAEAKGKAKYLAPQFNYNPYHKGLKGYFSKIIGWKLIRYMQYTGYRVFYK